MKTTNSIYFTSLLVVVLFSFASSCNPVPEEHVQAAREMIASAEAAEANFYAHDTYQAALDSLLAAEEEIKLQESNSFFSRDFSRASQLLEHASVLAEQSLSTIPEAKEIMQTEATTMLAEAEDKLATFNMTIEDDKYATVNPVLFASYTENSTEAGTLLTEAYEALEAGVIYEAHIKAGQVLDQVNALLEKIAEPATSTGL